MSFSPSQRIKLIKQISERLSGESWSIIDLTLKQFSLPTSDEGSGSTSHYVIAMTERAPDQILIDLAQHLGVPIEAASVSYIEPGFWSKGLLRIFISHIAAHKAWAAQLQEALLQFGISGFVAHNDIEPTLEWQDEIELALSTCDALVALLHARFHESKWTDQEIGFAMGRNVPVFSIKLGELPYGFIGKFQAFNGKNNEPYELAEDIFNACRKHKQTKGIIAQTLVTLFENSNNFAEAKHRIGYLEELDSWEPTFSKRIQDAVKNNNQIEYSWGVADRVNALAKKWSEK
jgi:hypothetical protein